MGDGRSVLVDKVISLLEHECSHSGCNERSPLKEIKQHEESCGFRLVNCPGNNCDKVFPFQ